MFEFLSPLFLVGMVAAAIPLVIHLSRSKRQKKMRFSTTRFFTDQFLRSYRMSRLKELLLLAMRMALFGLFAMALARPLFRPPGTAARFGGPRAVALVIDDSASMGYAVDGRTLLDRARESALGVLGELREGVDTATIVLASRRASGPELIFQEPTPELANVRQALRDLAPKSLGTDLAGAVRRAEQALAPATSASREIYVFSDLQDSGWELSEQEPADQVERARNLYFVVSIRPERPENLAITAVQYATSRPMAGVPFSIRPHVRNDSESPRSAEVRLYIDGQKVGERLVDAIPAGRWSTPRFSHVFATPGWHSGYVEISDQGMPTDDRRYFAFEVVGGVKVLAVNGAPSAVPRLDELFFLKAALSAGAPAANPPGETGGKGPATSAGDAVDLRVVDPTRVAQEELASSSLVILANVESLSPDAVEKLEAYVDAGGSLLWFLGDRVNPAFYNQQLAAAGRLHGGLLPARLARVEADAGGSSDFASLGEFDDGHPALASLFESDQAQLAGVSLKSFWGLEPAGARVLARTSTGSPLLVEKSFGKGKSMLMATTCDRDWTNFPVKPAFLPFAYRLLGYLAQGPAGRENFYNTGGQIPLSVSAIEGLPTVSLRKPDGALGHAVPTNDALRPLVFEDTTDAGVYQVVPAAASGKEGSPGSAGTSTPSAKQPGASPSGGPYFAVNLENLESDLLYLDEVLAGDATAATRDETIAAAIKQRLLPGRPLLAYVSAAERLPDVSIGARQGRPLWDLVLLVVLVIALIEPYIANRISQRHYARPRDILPPPIRGGRVVSLGQSDRSAAAQYGDASPQDERRPTAAPPA